MFLATSVWTALSAKPPIEEPMPGDLRRTSTVVAIEKAMPSVVNIATEELVPIRDPFEALFGEFFNPYNRRGPRGSRVNKNLGSGVIVDEDGFILTNAHVTRRASRIWVKLTDGRERECEKVVSNLRSDIALLKIIPDGEEKFTPVTFAQDDDLRLGETVIALGNPFGLGGSVSRGILSSKNRRPPIEDEQLDIADWLQTDAAINPGNSGGPLVNLRGELVGINTAILSQSGGYQGIGFAIPVNLATRIKNELIEHGEVLVGYLGISYQTMTDAMAEALGIGTETGVLINEVHPESPAERAGLRVEDVIVAIDGGRIENEADFQRRIGLVGSDREVRIKYWRGQRKRSTKTTLEASESTAGLLSKRNELLGWELQEISPDLARRTGFRPGYAMIVTDVAPQTTAHRAGLRRGDLLIEINRKPVGTFEYLYDVLAELDAGDDMLLYIRRGRSKFFVHIRMPGA